MKKSILSEALKPVARKRFTLARLWAELHPKPALPIAHPIPPLTPTPIPPPVGGKDSRFKARGKRLEVHSPKTQRPAVLDLLSRLLVAGLVVALLTTGCAGVRPLKGGKAVTTRKPAGVVEQTLVQGENASQPSKQDQESVKVRSYTVPAGSRIEESSTAAVPQARPASATPAGRPFSSFNPQPSTSFLLSAPMPVIERVESRARTELGAAQKDSAREIGLRLASLKGIVWVGLGLFIFGLASLVWPPLKALIASVTTSAAMMLGGIALMVLPNLVVGNELLILGVVAAAVGAWFLAHRHGQLRGMLDATAATQPLDAPPPRP